MVNHEVFAGDYFDISTTKGKLFLKVKLNQNIWEPYWALLRWDTDILI